MLIKLGSEQLPDLLAVRGDARARTQRDLVASDFLRGEDDDVSQGFKVHVQVHVLRANPNREP